jgi:hypothetical protein
MRKLTFLKTPTTILKLMIYERSNETFLFGYDSLADVSCVWDEWYETIEEAEEQAAENFDVSAEEWIEISNPCSTCQHDLITHTGVQVGDQKVLDFKGLTGNERLYLTGLMKELSQAVATDKAKAVKILTLLKFDKASIERMV